MVAISETAGHLLHRLYFTIQTLDGPDGEPLWISVVNSAFTPETFEALFGVGASATPTCYNVRGRFRARMGYLIDAKSCADQPASAVVVEVKRDSEEELRHLANSRFLV